MFTTIIWAADGSSATKRVLPVVRDLAELHGSTLVLAHVQEHFALGRRAVLEDDHRARDAMLQATVDGLKEDGVDAELALVDTRGAHAAEAMAELARDRHADLLVAGNHNQGPVAGLLMGSFTANLLKRAPCPVLVIPRPHHEPV